MTQPKTTNFPADSVPQAPEDPLFGLMAAYRADTFDKKVDLGIGAYRDNNAKPWVLPVVKKVNCTLLSLPARSSFPMQQKLTHRSEERRVGKECPV